MMETSQDRNLYQSGVIRHPASEASTALKVINMSWTDPDTYPPERAALLLGSDLVYDMGILAVLIPAICASLAAGTPMQLSSESSILASYLPLFLPCTLPLGASLDGSLLYCAPDTGRQGMEQLEQALRRVNIACVEKFSAPEE